MVVLRWPRGGTRGFWGNLQFTGRAVADHTGKTNRSHHRHLPQRDEICCQRPSAPNPRHGASVAPIDLQIDRIERGAQTKGVGEERAQTKGIGRTLPTL